MKKKKDSKFLNNSGYRQNHKFFSVILQLYFILFLSFNENTNRYRFDITCEIYISELIDHKYCTRGNLEQLNLNFATKKKK